MPVQKGTNRLINIAVELILACFEFYRNSLTLPDQIIYLLYADLHLLIKTFCGRNVENE